MSEFKDTVPHTGGVLTIHIKDHRYQLGYRHSNFKAAGLVELIAVDGEAVAGVNIGGLWARSEPPPPRLRIMLPTDGEGLYGRACPHCKGYFRTSNAYTERCPYCDHVDRGLSFLTDDQKGFIRRQYDAIRAAVAGPDGETTIDFDAQIAEPSRGDDWTYSEEKQQSHFVCGNCRLKFDVLGEYVRCPQCGQTTAREVILLKLDHLNADFETAAASIPKENREERQRRWRAAVSSAVADFEALGREIARVLSRHPMTGRRRKSLRETSFQNITGAAETLATWFDFDLLGGLSNEDIAFLHRMFQRRHLFSHNAGRVDQEYLDKTGDTTVRLHEVVRVGSNEVRRLLALVREASVKLLDGVDSLT